MSSEVIAVKFKKLTSTARKPERHLDAACFDLFSIENKLLLPGESVEIRTGIALELPDGYAGFLHTRSSMGMKGLRAHLGVIDPDFRGEITIFLFSDAKTPYMICEGDKVAQLYISPVLNVIFEETETLSETRRGENGFGSSGR